MSSPVTPPLFLAATRALGTFQRHFAPSLFEKLHVDNAERDAYIREWARPLIGITLEAITDAAQRWIGDPKKIRSNGQLEIPNAATFAQYARGIDRADYRPHIALVQPQPSNAARKNTVVNFAHRAAQQLGVRVSDFELIGEVWRVLLDGCVTDAERAAVRNGFVTMEAFDDAVAIVKASLPTQRPA